MKSADIQKSFPTWLIQLIGSSSLALIIAGFLGYWAYEGELRDWPKSYSSYEAFIQSQVFFGFLIFVVAGVLLFMICRIASFIASIQTKNKQSTDSSE